VKTEDSQRLFGVIRGKEQNDRTPGIIKLVRIPTKSHKKSPDENQDLSGDPAGNIALLLNPCK
jgi:hypothetical protein